jgi:hypothetical protein
MVDLEITRSRTTKVVCNDFSRLFKDPGPNELLRLKFPRTNISQPYT